MPYYENVFIARQDISASQVDSLANGFSETIEKQGGKVAKREYWGLRSLAYRIKKNRKGHYVLLNLDAPSDAVQEMERQMRINEDVLRYLTVRVDEMEEGPSVMMRSRGGRDDRARRFGNGARKEAPAPTGDKNVEAAVDIAVEDKAVAVAVEDETEDADEGADAKKGEDQ